MRYILFALRQLKLVGMVLLSGIFIYPFIVFPNRRKNWASRFDKKRSWYWRFSDTSERAFGTTEKNYLNSTYGVYEFVKKRNSKGVWEADYETFYALPRWRKVLYAYQWNVIRNGCWDYIASFKYPDAPREDLKIIRNDGGNRDGFDFRTRRNYGHQHCTWRQGDLLCFRISMTVPFGGNGKYINIQAGHAVDRELVKAKWFHPSEI
jgi:hypothetical protein